MGSTLIRGATIITLERQGVLPQGDLLVEGERIAAIAPKIDAPADEVVQASGCILIPGLVNAHMHT
ncbi:MAG: cytosine deaminase, partial [Quisquiliibacterium sp.]